MGSGLPGIEHIRLWDGNGEIVLLDDNPFVAEVLKETTKLYGLEKEIPVVYADFNQYTPAQNFSNLRINFSLHHFFKRGAGVDGRRLARVAFFEKANAILENDGTLYLFDRADEYFDLLKKTWEGDVVSFLQSKTDLDLTSFGSNQTMLKQLQVIAFLIQEMEAAGFLVKITELEPVQNVLQFKLTGSKERSLQNSESLAFISA